jgi:hypothetical protein
MGQTDNYLYRIYMILFIINGIVINLPKCIKIGHFKYSSFSYFVSLYKKGNALGFLVNLAWYNKKKL